MLHKVGAHRACAAAITLDSPGANYRTVWALSKYFPNVKTFVRAHDVDHGLNLEKAGATAVILLFLFLYHLLLHLFEVTQYLLGYFQKNPIFIGLLKKKNPIFIGLYLKLQFSVT